MTAIVGPMLEWAIETQLAYFGFIILVAPIMLVAAGFSWLRDKWSSR